MRVGESAAKIASGRLINIACWIVKEFKNDKMEAFSRKAGNMSK